MQTIKYSPGDEQLLMTRLWSPVIKDDPLAFVLLVFPWGQKGTPLEHFTGPRKWQRNILRSGCVLVQMGIGSFRNEFKTVHRFRTNHKLSFE